MLASSSSGYVDYVTTPSFERSFEADPFREFDTMDLIKLGTRQPLLGTGELLSPSSHRLQVGPHNVGLGPLTKNFYYGMGTIVSEDWVYANPQLVGYKGSSPITRRGRSRSSCL
jgi:hypothetical protein